MATGQPQIVPQYTVVSTEGVKTSYSAGVNITTFAASATDVFQIIGSATKTVKITRMEICADAAGQGLFTLSLTKRTTSNTGGTTALVASTPHDSYDPAATAVIQTYSVNPTALGTGSILRIDSVALPGAAATGYPYVPLAWDFGVRNTKCPTLHGGNESLVINLQVPPTGQTIPTGLSLFIDIEFTEE